MIFSAHNSGETLFAQGPIGIEVSPRSTHGRVAGKKKLEAESGIGAVEQKKIETWEKDTAKRNEYFTKFGITTLTLTDKKLANIGSAFEGIKRYLAPSIDMRRSNLQVDHAITEYTFDTPQGVDLT
jgi:hypothetical protein